MIMRATLGICSLRRRQSKPGVLLHVRLQGRQGICGVAHFLCGEQKSQHAVCCDLNLALCGVWDLKSALFGEMKLSAGLRFP